MRLLLAEDDTGLRAVLTRALTEQGHEVDAARDGAQALELAEGHVYDVAIIDWRMPKVSGIQVVQQLRSQGVDTKIMMVTARDAAADRVRGLDAGADDYLVKPFDLAELIARVRALIRRKDAIERELSCGDVVYDILRDQVLIAGEAISLTMTERAILEVLLFESPEMVSKVAIAARIWPADFHDVTPNTIDVHLGRLRAKLARAHVQILTVRKGGHRIVESA